VTTSSESAAGLLPATRRALTHRVAVGQAEGRTPSLTAAVVQHGKVTEVDAIRGYVEALGGTVDVVARVGDWTVKVA
jgi:hypothetical protein